VEMTEPILGRDITPGSRLSVPFGSLFIILLHAIGIHVHPCNRPACGNITICCGFLIPSDRPRVIFTHAVSVVVDSSETALRLAVSLSGGFLVPRDGLRVALGHASSIEVQIPHRTLGTTVALSRGLQEPYRRFVIVLSDTLAGGVGIRERNLCKQVTPVCGLLEPAYGLCGGLLDAVPELIQQAEMEFCRGVALIGRRLTKLRLPTHLQVCPWLRSNTTARAESHVCSPMAADWNASTRDSQHSSLFIVTPESRSCLTDRCPSSVNGL